MLSGDNGILQKATDAKIKSDESQITERIQLAELSARTIGKGELTYSNLTDELTKEFGTKGTGYDISEEESETWTVTVGNVNYEISNISNNLSSITKKDESEKLLQYLSQENWNDVYDEENYCYKDNDSIGIIGNYLHEINGLELFYYNGGIYKAGIDNSTNTPKVELVKFFDNMTEYKDEIENRNLLITPKTPENPIHEDYEGPYTLSDKMYFLKSNNDLSLSRTYYIMHDSVKGTIVNNYYDDSGAFIVSGLHPEQVEVEGPQTFSNMYYVVDNKPFTNGYYSYDTRNYYDETGKLVQVSRSGEVD